MPAIYVAIEGGIVQSVSTDIPGLAGIQYVVIDYDIEGADEDDCDDVVDVVQIGGKVEQAVLGGGEVDELAVTIRTKNR
jgi:hypothetical protein